MTQGKKRHRLVALTGTLVLVWLLCAAAHGIMLPQTDWLNIGKLNTALPANPNHDSFVLSGSFNMGPGFLDPSISDVTLSLENWTVTITADEWTKKGKTDKYTAKHDRVRGEIKYWVGGSSRCDFKFTATRQDLQSQIPSFPEVPVRLRIGVMFDVSAVAVMEQHGKAAKMVALGPDPSYVTDKINAQLNQKKPDSDRAVIMGRIYMEEEFDPDVDVIVLRLGDYVAIVPAGSITLPSGDIIRHKTTQGDGSELSLLVNTESGRIVFWVKKADLSSLASPSEVTLVINGIDDAAWPRLFWFGENKKGTVLRY